MLKHIFKSQVGFYLRQLLAVFFILLGAIITPMPIPIGFVMIMFGITILAYDNKRILRFIRIQRRKFPQLSDGMEKIETKNILFLSEVLKRTNPKFTFNYFKKDKGFNAS